MRDVFARGEGWYAHVAGPDDNDSLVDVLRRVPMGGAVATGQDRAPDFFAWLRAQGGIAEAGLVRRESDDAPIGLGTSIVREVCLPDGTVGPLGTIADIRVLPEWRRARVVPGLGHGSLARLRRLYGVDLCTTAVADANVPVRHAAVSRSPPRAPQPVATPVARYGMVCVLGPRRGMLRTRPTRQPGDATVSVTHATTDDLDELAAFLDDGQRRRVLGHAFPRKLLEERFAAWPGLAPASFLLARDGAGRFLGCAAPWDAAPLRRMVVSGYRGALRWARPALGALARLRGVRPLPPPGGALCFATLSHLEVAGDEPEVLASLLDAAWRDPASRELSFLALMVPAGSRLEAGLAGFPTVRVPMTLLALALPGSPWAGRGFDASRPSFEMALA